jgi:hypothetical protein
MDSTGWNFIVFVPASFIVFVWDIMQNHGAGFRLFANAVRSAAVYFGYYI